MKNRGLQGLGTAGEIKGLTDVWGDKTGKGEPINRSMHVIWRMS